MPLVRIAAAATATAMLSQVRFKLKAAGHPSKRRDSNSERNAPCYSPSRSFAASRAESGAESGTASDLSQAILRLYAATGFLGV